MIVDFNANNAEYVGNKYYGVYYQVAKGLDGWYVTAVVDSDSFVDTIYRNKGPFKTKGEALIEGILTGMNWCLLNDVTIDQDRYRKLIEDMDIDT